MYRLFTFCQFFFSSDTRKLMDIWGTGGGRMGERKVSMAGQDTADGMEANMRTHSSWGTNQ